MLNSISLMVEELSSDPHSPQLNFNMGVQYESIGQTATAVSFYLRAAEYGYHTDKTVAYCALLKVGQCLEMQSNRDWNVSNSYLQAVQFLPDRPEAYYFLSKFYEKQGHWQEAYTYASIGSDKEDLINQPLPMNIGYEDKSYLLIQKAVSAWSLGLRDESINIMMNLGDTKNLPESSRQVVLTNFKNLNLSLNKIAVILPVRDAGTGRNQRLIKCLNSWAKTTEGKSDLHVIIDEDDVQHFPYLFERKNKLNIYIRPANLTLMEKLNSVAMDVAYLYKYMMFVGDDIQFKTPWESRFIEYLSSVPAGLVYGETLDLPPHVDWATHPCITTNMVKAVGFYGCPAVAHNFFDNFWSEVAKEIGHFKKLPDVITDHRRTGWEPDSLYQKIVDLFDSDKEKYEEYKETKFTEDLQKIKSSVGL